MRKGSPEGETCVAKGKTGNRNPEAGYGLLATIALQRAKSSVHADARGRDGMPLANGEKDIALRDDGPARFSFAHRLVRRGLHSYWRFSRGMTLGVRAIVLDTHDRVCLVRHTYTPGWYLPGGGVEPGETGLDALIRELREEARIEAAAQDFRLHGVFFNQAVSKRDHVIVYVVRSFRVIEPKQPDREIAEAGFFPIPALPHDATKATRRRLKEVAGEIPVATEW